MRFRDRFDRSKRKPSTRNQRIGFAAFWFLVVSYAYFISSAASFNTVSHLYPAFSVVDHHTLNIDRYGSLPPLAMNLAYDVAIYGKPFATGYTYVHSSLYASHAKSGLFGLPDLASYGVQAPSLNSLWQITFGPYRGIFVVSPVLLLFVVGMRALWKRRDLRAEWVLCVAVVCGYFLLDAARPENMNGWSGGWSIASRHLTPILPFMVFPIVFALGRPLWRRTFLGLGAVSAAVMYLIMATGNGGGFAYGDRNPLVNEVWKKLLNGHVEVNWGYLAGQMGVPSLIPLGLLVGLFGTRIAWLYRSPTAPAAVRERQLAAADAS